MSGEVRTVSKKYALHEFKTIGFVLILYAMCVLYLPLIINELPNFFGEKQFFGFDLYRIAHVLCLVFGTLVPFFLLSLTNHSKKSEVIVKRKTSFGENICNYIVFTVAITTSIFVTMMLGQYVNVNGQLVSSIGITFNTEYMDDIIYIVTFVILTPLIEEYAFRGSLLKCLSRYGKYFALIATSLIYALAHGSFVEMIPAYFMNLILAKFALRYKSIKPCIFVHILYNITIFALYHVPENYSKYMAIGLGLFLIVTAVLLITKTYKYMTVRKSTSNKQVTITFLSSFTVSLAMLLLILHSVLLLVI